jgi:uncharacterized phiE125 gp8 family phage protein
MPKVIQEVIEITAPSVEPITLAEAKAQARIDTTTSAEDNLIEDIYIPAARKYLENITGRTFHQKTLEWMLTDFPDCDYVVLRQATPLVSITSLKYKDTTGSETTWASSNYIADTDSKTGRLVLAYGIVWPNSTLYPSWPIRIRGVAGIATASPITEADPMAKLAIAELVSGNWNNRDSEELPDRPIISTVKFSYGVQVYIDALRREYVF